MDYLQRRYQDKIEESVRLEVKCASGQQRREELEVKVISLLLLVP
jgi:hypothetical protein